MRHTAQAPAVDVDLRRVYKSFYRTWKYFFLKELDIANTDDMGAEEFGPVEFRPGRIEADLLAAGTDTVAVTSPILNVNRGTRYIVYAIGQLGGDFALFVQAIDL